MSHNDSKPVKPTNVFDMQKFRTKKSTEQEFAHGGRKPLYISYLDGQVKGSPHFQRHDSEDFGERMQRIKASLERINQLMADLKKSAKDAPKN